MNYDLVVWRYNFPKHLNAALMCLHFVSVGRFRVSEQGPIKRCQRGVWLCSQVRSAGKLFLHSYAKLLKVSLRRI